MEKVKRQFFSLQERNGVKNTFEENYAIICVYNLLLLNFKERRVCVCRLRRQKNKKYA